MAKDDDDVNDDDGIDASQGGMPPKDGTQRRAVGRRNVQRKEWRYAAARSHQ